MKRTRSSSRTRISTSEEKESSSSHPTVGRNSRTQPITPSGSATATSSSGASDDQEHARSDSRRKRLKTTEGAEPIVASRSNSSGSRPAAPTAASRVSAPDAPPRRPGGEGDGASDPDDDDEEEPASGDSGELRAWGLRLPGSSRKSPWPGHDDLAVDNKTYAYLSGPGEQPMTFGLKLPQSGAAVLREYASFATPMAYGLGKSGWVAFKPSAEEMPTFRQIRKWVLESYQAQAKKSRIKQLEAMRPQPL